MPIRTSALDAHHNIKFNRKSGRYQRIGAAIALIAAGLGCAASLASGAVFVLAPLALIATLLSGFFLYKSGTFSRRYAKTLKEQQAQQASHEDDKTPGKGEDKALTEANIKLNKRDNKLDKAGAVASVIAAGLGCAASLALPAAPILAPLALVAALISGICWYRSGVLAKRYANKLNKDHKAKKLQEDLHHLQVEHGLADEKEPKHKTLQAQKRRVRDISFNKKSSILNKVAATTAIIAGALGCAAALASGAVMILAPIALVAAVISGICWYKAGALSKDYAKQVKKDVEHHATEEEDTKKRARIKAILTQRASPTNEAPHHVADVMRRRAVQTSHPHAH